MSEADFIENDIVLRHRKEKKELQCKIQSLKKSASKGDKKKKKEVLDEIAKIESELTKRHSEELNNLNNAKNINQLSNNELIKTNEKEICDATENNSDEGGGILNIDKINIQELRVSKAQRRRDKKAQKEKEKEAEVAAEELLYKNGPRTLETRALKDLLKKRGLKLYSIPSDGDCLYNAICHQMSLIGKSFGPVECNINQKEQIKYLRNETANYIENNKDTLIFYMTSLGTDDLMSDEEFNIYCNQIRNTSAWGGQLEIRAIANILRVKIEVLQANGPPTIQSCEENGGNGPTLTITYHRHMFSLGEHYNSTISFDSDYEEDDNSDKEDEEET